MNKNMLYGVLGIVAVSIAFYLFISNKSVSTEKELPEIPEAYRSYENLLDGFETETHLVERVVGSNDASYADLKYFNPRDSSLLVLTNNYSGKINVPQPWMDTYLKMNKEGQIIDSLSKPYWIYTEVLGHLLARDHYSSWVFNGDENEKAYKNLSLEASSTKVQMLANFKKHYQEAEIVKYHKYFDKPTKTWIHSGFLLINGAWNIISQKDILNFDEMFKEYPSKPHYEAIELLQLGAQTIPWTKDSDDLKLIHFQKTRFQKERSNGTFSSTNATLRATWNGIAYFNLVRGQNTIPFKLNMRQDKQEIKATLLPNGDKLTIFKHEYLNFMLLGHGEGQLYCIKPK